MGSLSTPFSNKFLRNSSLLVFSVFALKITSACWFRAFISLVQRFSPNDFSPNSSIQSGIDSLYFLIFDNSSNLPLIFRVGTGSICFQSGNSIPLKTAHIELQHFLHYFISIFTFIKN